MSSNAKNQLRVMLINPPQKYFYNSLGFNSYFPIGLLGLGAMIKDICQVRIFDCLIEKFTEQKEEMFTIFGTSPADIKSTIKEFDPDIVGICIPFSAQSQNGINVAKICRQVDPNITIVMGGPHPSVRYKYLLETEPCDYCAVGEGEVTFQKYIEAANEKVGRLLSLSPDKFHKQARSILKNTLFEVDGMAYLKNGAVEYKSRTALQNLDELPFPAYELIDPKDYLASPYLYKSRSAIGQKSMSMITSRGCPYECVFCSISQHMGRTYRYNSPEYVIRHLEYCVDYVGVKKFHFEDDNFSLHRGRFRTILDAIIDKKLGIEWDTPNGIRADSLKYETVVKMKQAGASCLQIAVESGNQKVLNEVIKKDADLEAYHDVAKWCHEVGITLGAFYVIGFPGETIPDMRDTTNLALHLFKEYNVFPILLFATPLYGTELYLNAVELGLIKEALSDEEFATATQFYGTPLLRTKDFTPEDLKRIAKEFEEDIDAIANKQGALRTVLADKTSLVKNNGGFRNKDKIAADSAPLILDV